jgi:ribosomal protein S12 methylthiotransferase accessory factor
LVEVYHALGQLEQKGHLAEAQGSRAPGTEAFWHIQDIDLAGAAQRLAGMTVAVTRLAGLEVDPLVMALRGLHVRVAERGGLGVVLTDDYLRAGLEAYNREALDSGRPWLLAKPVGCRVWIGPVFVPHQTGCWECLAQRLRRNREAESYLQARMHRVDPFPVPRADTPATRALAWSLAATEVVRWIARGGASDLEGKVLTPTLSPLRRGRALDRSAWADPLGRGDHQPLLPAGEKVPEGPMRGSDGQFFSGL